MHTHIWKSSNQAPQEEEARGSKTEHLEANGLKRGFVSRPSAFYRACKDKSIAWGSLFDKTADLASVSPRRKELQLQLQLEDNTDIAVDAIPLAAVSGKV